MKIRDIGLEIKKPEGTCVDKHCPFHGELVVRGRYFVGTVVRMNAQKTAVVEWDRLFYLPKYQRYEKRSTRLQVHNPSCLNIKMGDKVTILESRPISKTKSFVILQKE